MSKRFFVLVTVLCFIVMVIGFFIEPTMFIFAAPLVFYNCLLLLFLVFSEKRKSAAKAADYIKNNLEAD